MRGAGGRWVVARSDERCCRLGAADKLPIRLVRRPEIGDTVRANAANEGVHEALQNCRRETVVLSAHRPRRDVDRRGAGSPSVSAFTRTSWQASLILQM